MREKDRERERKERDLPGWMTVATITKVKMTFALFMLSILFYSVSLAIQSGIKINMLCYC